MNKTAVVLVAAAAALAASGLGYWWGSAQGRASADGGVVAVERKPLYYRNPMGLPDTSPLPKKAPDGMDYIPVYADEASAPAPDGGAPFVNVSPEKVQALGVRTERVLWRALAQTVRAVATIQADERRLHTVAPKFEGWIQKLHVNATGQAVARGQPLMDVYSPDLVAAQQEYLIAVKGVASVPDAAPEVVASMRELRESALLKLRNWDISEAELGRLKEEGVPRQYVTLRSQANGVVLEKPAIEGKRFMPGEILFQIADLSSVWLLADVFEQDLGSVRPGQPATIRIDAYPGRDFAGRVTFVYPTVTSETRTAKVRIEMANPAGALKPSMYASVEIAAGRVEEKVLALPDSAILDTGTRQLVIVRRGEGTFEPRTVKLGRRADGYVEAREGVRDGDTVVVSANFLIDAESNLKAALSGFGAGQAAPADRPAASVAHSGH